MSDPNQDVIEPGQPQWASWLGWIGLLAISLLAVGWLLDDGARRFTAPVLSLPRQQTIWYGLHSALPPPLPPMDADAELGIEVVMPSAGEVVAIRLFHFAGYPSPTTGTVWSADGEALAGATFPQAEGPGWREAMLDRPVAVKSGDRIVVSVFQPGGRVIWQAPEFRAFAGPMRHPYPDFSLPDAVPEPRSASRFAPSGHAVPEREAKKRSFWIDLVFVPLDARR